MSDAQKMILASKISGTPINELDYLFTGTALAHDPVIQALIDKLSTLEADFEAELEAKYEAVLEECEKDKKDQDERIEYLEFLLNGTQKIKEKKDKRGRKPVYPSLIWKVLQDSNGRATRQAILEAIKKEPSQALKNFNPTSVLNAVAKMMKTGLLHEMHDGSVST